MVWDREVAVSGQRQWNAAWVAWLVAVAAAGCSDRHLPSNPSSEDAPEDDGGGTAAEDEAPWLVDGGDLRVLCPVAQGLEEALVPSCLGIMHTLPCELGDVCAHYARGSTAGSADICTFRCRQDLDPPHWAFDCSNACDYQCPEPAPGAPLVELDTSDCANRPLRACDADRPTLQSQLDAELRALMPEVAESYEIKEQAVTVLFENGCATRVVAPNASALAFIEPIARQALGASRLRCATELGCGTIHGPSTLP